MMVKLDRWLRDMGSKLGNRFIIVLIVITSALILAGVIGLVSLILPTRSTAFPAKTAQKDCASCHPEIQSAWHTGSHSDTKSKHALSQGTNCSACHKTVPVVNVKGGTENSSPKDFLVNQGSSDDCLACHVTGYDKTTGMWKSDGISCEACHGVIPDDHPKTPVTVDKSGANCLKCHTSDRFDWGKWKESVHYQKSIACVNCHNPHTTSLKTVEGTQRDSSELCKNCHKEISQSYEHTAHKSTNVACKDCHLGDPKGNDDFHQVPDHDFKPKIEACNKCHANQMHAAGKSKGPEAAQKPVLITRSETTNSNKNVPQTSYNLLGFSIVALFFGVIGGATLRKSIFKK